MNCPTCCNTVADDERYCPHCATLIEPPSLWQKLLAAFRPPLAPRSSNVTTVVSFKKMNIVTNVGGASHEYHSLEEAPPELRAEIEAAQAEALQNGTGVSRTFRVCDASGQERTYHSLDEMPTDIRALVEQARRNLGAP